VIRFALAAALFLSLALVAPTVRAQHEFAQREAAELANRGYEKFKRGDYDEAIALFEQAETLSHSPVILSFVAQSYEKLGRLIQAQRQYARVANEALDDDAPEDFVKAQRQARRLVPILERRIPRIVLRISGVPLERVEVILDGRALSSGLLGKPLRVNPGARRLVLKVAGEEPVERTITATERQLTDVELLLADRVVEKMVPTPVQAEPSWVPPVIAYGAGLAGLTLGITAGVLYLDRSAALHDRCPDDRCAPELSGEKDAIDAIGVVSLVGFGVGLAGAAVGTVLVVMDRDDATGPEAQLVLRPGHLSLEGRF